MKTQRPRSAREKYGEELRLRRQAAEMTQEDLGSEVVCSATLISHIEAGRRLPNIEDAKRIDKALGTDGWFARWLHDLESRYADHFAEAAELEQQAIEIREYAAMLVPGVLQTEDYARAVFAAYTPNHTTSYLEQRVVNRLERARLLTDPTTPVVWTLLDEAVLRRCVGGPKVMVEQLTRIAGMADDGRLRLHVVPFGVGAHALMEGMLSLMTFADTAPTAYVECMRTGRLVDDPVDVAHCRSAYDLTLGDALSQQESVGLVRAVAEEYAHEH